MGDVNSSDSFVGVDAVLGDPNAISVNAGWLQELAASFYAASFNINSLVIPELANFTGSTKNSCVNTLTKLRDDLYELSVAFQNTGNALKLYSVSLVGIQQDVQLVVNDYMNDPGMLAVYKTDMNSLVTSIKYGANGAADTTTKLNAATSSLGKLT